jgi:hypothetical protein
LFPVSGAGLGVRARSIPDHEQFFCLPGEGLAREKKKRSKFNQNEKMKRKKSIRRQGESDYK